MGEWSRCPDFCYSKSPILELSGKKIGIIGFGRIGQKVGMVAEALGMKVLFFSPSLQVQKPNLPSIETVFAQCDVVSLHCPLTKDNVGFVNRSLLKRMKPSALLINTSRGQLINEEDLAWALSNSVIAGAAVDVLSVEPPPPTHPLLNIPNCIITPHNAWISFEARERIMKTTLENIELALAGKPQNIVS
jgi:glycerate dehydrogenase